MTPAVTQKLVETYRQPLTLTILRRLYNKDRTAVNDCINKYGNLIWALAKKFTSSTGEAEFSTKRIFMDIWKYAERGEINTSPEERVIATIAWKRLVKETMLKRDAVKLNENKIRE